MDFGKVKLNLVTIYRPPQTPLFIEQFQNLLSDLVSLKSSCIIMGDLNIHLDATDNAENMKFNVSQYHPYRKINLSNFQSDLEKSQLHLSL